METVRDVHETMRENILPVLLDNTKTAHRLSARLFRRYGLVSLIFGRPSLRDLFDLSSHTLRLPHTDCDRLQVEELIALAAKSEGKLLLLIPCSDRARATVARFAPVLESRFLLLDADTALTASPLSDIQQAYSHSPLT